MPEENSNTKFDWRVVAASVVLVLGQGLIQYGITTATLVEIQRRLDIIEKRMDERSVAREEYERRHEDLTRQVQELRTEVRELERKTR